MKLTGLRWKALRSYTLAAVVVAAIFGIILPSVEPILVALEPPWAAQVVLAASLFVLLALVNAAVTIYWSKNIKERLDDVIAFTAVLSRGNLSQRIQLLEHDEIGRLEWELNGLAEKIQKHVESLQRLAAHNEELAEKVHSATIIEERQRFARELHDAVNQQLFALTMLADAAVVTAGSGSANQEQIREIADLAAQAQQEMRALLLHLRPVQLVDDTLVAGIAKLAKELERKSGIVFDISHQPLPSLARGVENHLFRIVQEALANALRHSAATTIRLNLFARENELFLHISDNGKGFNPKQDNLVSYGLKTMRERCEDIGGELTVTSRQGEGTRLDIRVPLKGKDEDHDRTN